MTEITDLHGNTYKLGDYTLEYNFPKFSDYKFGVYTKDIITGKTMDIITCYSGNIYGIRYSMAYRLYVVYKLEFISYNNKLDIRKAYLHGNKYHA